MHPYNPAPLGEGMVAAQHFGTAVMTPVEVNQGVSQNFLVNTMQRVDDVEQQISRQSSHNFQTGVQGSWSSPLMSGGEYSNAAPSPQGGVWGGHPSGADGMALGIRADGVESIDPHGSSTSPLPHIQDPNLVGYNASHVVVNSPPQEAFAAMNRHRPYVVIRRDSSMFLSPPNSAIFTAHGPSQGHSVFHPPPSGGGAAPGSPGSPSIALQAFSLQPTQAPASGGPVAANHPANPTHNHPHQQTAAVEAGELYPASSSPTGGLPVSGKPFHDPTMAALIAVQAGLPLALQTSLIQFIEDGQPPLHVCGGDSNKQGVAASVNRGSGGVSPGEEGAELYPQGHVYGTRNFPNRESPPTTSVSAASGPEAGDHHPSSQSSPLSPTAQGQWSVESSNRKIIHHHEPREGTVSARPKNDHELLANLLHFHANFFPPPPPPRLPSHERRRRVELWYHYVVRWDVTHRLPPPPRTPLPEMELEYTFHLKPLTRVPYHGNDWLEMCMRWFDVVQNLYDFPIENCVDTRRLGPIPLLTPMHVLKTRAVLGNPNSRASAVSTFTISTG